MSKETIVRGQVIEVHPNNLFTVQFENPEDIEKPIVKKCYLSGKMRHNHIQVVVGDFVEVILDPYNGTTTNRIVKRK